MGIKLLEVLLVISVATAMAEEVFRADFTKATLAEAFDGAKISYGENNVALKGDHIEVTYPAGSYKPSHKPVGGFGLYTNHRVTRSARLQYAAFFPDGFDFVKGGKMPGLYGGKTSCTGGDPAVDCFSTRLMWRTDGAGEGYLYANRDAQDPAICEDPKNECNPTYGWSLQRGSYYWKTGAWTHIEETVTLNTPGVQDGTLAIKVDGVEAFRYDNIVFRIADYPDIVVSGLDVETFFGGSSEDWATPDTQVVKFKDFVLYSD